VIDYAVFVEISAIVVAHIQIFDSRLDDTIGNMCKYALVIITGKNDLTRRATHREAVFRTVFHSIFDAWHYEVLWTCAITMIHR